MATLTDFQTAQICDELTVMRHRQLLLRVHSVFSRACNLQTPDGALWVVQAQGTPLSPAGMVINCADLRPFFIAGEPIRREGGRLRGARLHIDLRCAVPVSTRLRPGGERQTLALLAEQIASFLAHQPVKGIRQALQSENSLNCAHRALIHWLRCGEGTLPALLRAFIGYGEGLTPSGDDFLLGVLLVLDNWRIARGDALKQALPALLDCTTDVSRAMLTQGCHGHYGVLLLALATSESQARPQAISRIADYGHTSGHDLLMGMLTAAQALA